VRPIRDLKASSRASLSPESSEDVEFDDHLVVELRVIKLELQSLSDQPSASREGHKRQKTGEREIDEVEKKAHLRLPRPWLLLVMETPVVQPS
jgi:hypothetical protein